MRLSPEEIRFTSNNVHVKSILLTKNCTLPIKEIEDFVREWIDSGGEVACGYGVKYFADWSLKPLMKTELDLYHKGSHE